MLAVVESIALAETSRPLPLIAGAEGMAGMAGLVIDGFVAPSLGNSPGFATVRELPADCCCGRPAGDAV